MTCHHIITEICAFNVIYHSRYWPWSPGWGWRYNKFLFCKVLFSSLLYSAPWKKITICRPHLRSVVIWSSFLRMEYLHKLFRNSSAWDICLFILIYFVNYLHLVWTKKYLFYTLGYGTMLVYLFCGSNCSSFGHSELFKLYCCLVSVWQNSINAGFLFCFVSNSLLSVTIICSRIILCIFLDPKPTISPRFPYPICWTMILKTKIQVLQLLLVATGHCCL